MVLSWGHRWNEWCLYLTAKGTPVNPSSHLFQCWSLMMCDQLTIYSWSESTWSDLSVCFNFLWHCNGNSVSLWNLPPLRFRFWWVSRVYASSFVMLLCLVFLWSCEGYVVDNSLNPACYQNSSHGIPKCIVLINQISLNRTLVFFETCQLV